MRIMYAVAYRKGLKHKDRLFDTLEEAKSFTFKCKMYGDDYYLYRIEQDSRFQQLLKSEVYWLGRRIRITIVLAVIATGYLIWRNL